MTSPDLINYVSQMKALNKSDVEIRAMLVAAKWPEADINQVLTPTQSMDYQGIGIRFVAQVIDGVIWFLGFGYVFALLFNQTTSDGFSLTGLPAFLLFLSSFAYFIVMETLLGGTVGKKIMKLRVVDESGGSITWQSSIIRNLGRLVDILPLFYLAGMFSIKGSPQKQRFGDKWAHTVVIKS